MGRLLRLKEIRNLQWEELAEASRLRARSTYLGDGRCVCWVLGRYKMFVDTGDRGFAPHVLLDGFWEIWLTRFIAHRVPRGGVAADIGANYGYHTVLMADVVGSQGQVFAFEPNPAAARALTETVEINGFLPRTRIHCAAVGDRSGAARLSVPAGQPKNAHLLSKDAAAYAGAETFEVPVVTIDELFGEERRLDFAKIDAEGAEEAIIGGGRRTFARWQPDVILEFNPRRASDPAGFLDELASIWRSVRVLDFDSQPIEWPRERLIDRDDPHDRLLVLSR